MRRRMKTLLLIVPCCSFYFALAGELHRGPKAAPPSQITGEEGGFSSRYTGPYPSTYSPGPGDSICFTTYDYGSNGSPLRNLINYGDGYLAMVRMAAQFLDPGTGDRGGYHFCSNDGGQTWRGCGDGRIETVRRGWDNVDQMADAGGIEVVASHIPVEVNVDVQRCLGVWSSTLILGSYLYPRVAVGSTFVIHIV